MQLQATSLGREPRPEEIKRMRHTLAETLAGLVDVLRRSLQREDAPRRPKPTGKAGHGDADEDDDLLDDMAVW